MGPPRNTSVDDEQQPTECGTQPIEQATFALLVRAAARLEAELNRVFRPFDLTAATYNILLVLESSGSAGQSCGDISEKLVAEVPDMTRLLDRLERLGYVVRERSSIDRRMVKVTLADRGSSVLAGLQQLVRDCHVRQLGHLGEAKLTELSSLLRVVLDRSPEEPRKQARIADISLAGGKHPPH